MNYYWTETEKTYNTMSELMDDIMRYHPELDDDGLVDFFDARVIDVDYI